jgi:hypothetical protein
MMRTTLASAVLLVALTACGSDPASQDPPSENPITIDGNNVSASDGLVFIRQGGQSITDASVTVTANGVGATQLSGGHYFELPTPLTPGATLTVQATRLTETASVTATMPSTPVFTAPAANDPVTIGTPLTVSWTSGTNPEYFLIRLGYRVGNTGMSVGDSVAGTVRTVNIPTAAIPPGATLLSIDIRAIGPETLGGDAAASSRLRLYATTEDRPLILNPVP